MIIIIPKLDCVITRNMIHSTIRTSSKHNYKTENKIKTTSQRNNWLMF